MRNVMRCSFLPVPEDRAGAIITLLGLGHERRGYAGIPVDARGHEIQAGYVRLATTSIHMNPRMRIRWSSICTLSRDSVRIAGSWGLLPHRKRCVNQKFRLCASRSTEQSLLNTDVKNLLTVIRCVNRRRRRPILYPHHAIISHEEVRPTPMMRSCPTALGEGK